MPYKSQKCIKCRRKMKHHKWVSYLRTGPYGAKQWNRIIKCPDCGNEQNDLKARARKY